MVNYTNSKIYKIFSNNSTKIYVGSTTKQYLSTRLAQHVSQFRHSKINVNAHNFTTSFLVLEDGDCQIELLELFPCTCRDELSAREGYWQREFNDLLVNRHINKLAKTFVGRKPYTLKVPFVIPPMEKTTTTPKKERKPYTRTVPYEDTEHYKLFHKFQMKTETV